MYCRLESIVLQGILEGQNGDRLRKLPQKNHRFQVVFLPPQFPPGGCVDAFFDDCIIVVGRGDRSRAVRLIL
jgi:hypothetical protein